MSIPASGPYAEPVLSVDRLVVAFRGYTGEKVVVNNVSFQVLSGEIVGILGESGSGKTTLGSAILSLLPPGGKVVDGSLKFDGRELVGLGECELRRIRGAGISTVSQEPRIALNPVMRVGTQVAEVVRAHRAWSTSKCREAALAALAEARLEAEKVYDAFPHELSGGQCQRVAIAQALVCQPKLVIADEPTSALDSTVQAEILELIAGLRKRLGIAFLFITHNPAIVAKYADRVLVMRAGEIVEQGETRSVLEHPAHPYTRALLQARARLLQSSSSI